MNITAVRQTLITFGILFAVVAGLAACSTIRTGSHYDETTHFAAYRTFSWIADDPYIGRDPNLAVSPLTQSKIETAIRDQLQTKGYAYVAEPADADFVVAYTIGSRERISMTAYPRDYRGAWGWHVHDSYYYVREYETHSYTEGTLGVDIFDGKTKKPVWHGWAEKTITEGDRQDPGPLIRDAVTRLFGSFPR